MKPTRESIVTARCVGARIREEDLADFQAFYADPAVMETLSVDGRVWQASESAALFERHLEHWRTHGFGTLVFRDPADASFVGRAGLRSVVIGDGREVELFYGIDSRLWGRGLATEIALAIAQSAFEDLPLDGLVGFTLPKNTRSRRVLEKCGFEPAGDFVHAGLVHLLFRLPRAACPPAVV